MLNFRLGSRGAHELQPVLVRNLCGRRENLHGIAALELVPQRHNLAVYLRTHAMIADFRVDGIGKIDRRRPQRHLLDHALRREHIDHIVEQIEFDRVHELAIIGQIPLPFHELVQPAECFPIFLFKLTALLVLPVRGNTLFTNPMHLVRANLKLHVLSLQAGYGRVQGLVQVRLRNRNVVLEPSRDRPPQGMDDP